MASRIGQERERIGWFILIGSFLSLNQTNQRGEMNRNDQMNQTPATRRETVLCGCSYPPVRVRRKVKRCPIFAH